MRGNYPKIRVFTAAPEKSAIPIEELLGMKLNWSAASPESIGGSNWTHMSAVCWLYGRMIHQALGGRPIGLHCHYSQWNGHSILDATESIARLQHYNVRFQYCSISVFYSFSLVS